MKITSHFVWIELKPKIFSNLFVKVYKYLKENEIENSVAFQNLISIHLTLYYFKKELNKDERKSIKETIKDIKLNSEIMLSWFEYFFGRVSNLSVLYFSINTVLPLENYRNKLAEEYNQSSVEDNSFDYIPHITFLIIKDLDVFEKHRENIENIISLELGKILDTNISNGKVFLYAVNSKFKEEIQIKI